MMMLEYRPLAAVIGSTGTRSTAKGAARKYACVSSSMMSANPFIQKPDPFAPGSAMQGVSC